MRLLWQHKRYNPAHKNTYAHIVLTHTHTLTSKLYRPVLLQSRNVSQLKDPFITEWPCVHYGIWWMQGCSAAWQEDGLCCTGKHVYAWHSSTHISVQSWKNYKRGHHRKSIFIVRYISTSEKCVHCFYATTHPPNYSHLSLCADQNAGLYSCGILIWDLWSLIAHEQ